MTCCMCVRARMGESSAHATHLSSSTLPLARKSPNIEMNHGVSYRYKLNSMNSFLSKVTHQNRDSIYNGYILNGVLKSLSTFIILYNMYVQCWGIYRNASESIQNELNVIPWHHFFVFIRWFHTSDFGVLCIYSKMWGIFVNFWMAEYDERCQKRRTLLLLLQVRFHFETKPRIGQMCERVALKSCVSVCVCDVSGDGNKFDIVRR